MPNLIFPDLNFVLIAGRVVADPELRATPNGRYVSRFRFAYSRRYKLANGELKEDRLFIDVVAWDKQADYVKQYLKKGRAIIIEGQLRYEEWESRVDGVKRSRIYILLRRATLLDRLPSEQGIEEGVPLESDYEATAEHIPNVSDSAEDIEPTVGNKWDSIPEDDVPF
ncbi:MAG: single-stranded DNA-binding protein [Candidatus Hydrogenedentes bacterium]|nr:single-stranded DNA-binding protein [Candidatus Hydrogenedentota bacterium]